MPTSGITLDDEVKSIFSQGFQNSEKTLRVQAAIIKLASQKKNRYVVDKLIVGNERPKDLFRRLYRDIICGDYEDSACWVAFDTQMTYQESTGESGLKTNLTIAYWCSPTCPVTLKMPMSASSNALISSVTHQIAVQVMDKDEWTPEKFLGQKNQSKVIASVDGYKVSGKGSTYKMPGEPIPDKLEFVSYEEYVALKEARAK